MDFKISAKWQPFCLGLNVLSYGSLEWGTHEWSSLVCLERRVAANMLMSFQDIAGDELFKCKGRCHFEGALNMG